MRRSCKPDKTVRFCQGAHYCQVAQPAVRLPVKQEDVSSTLTLTANALGADGWLRRLMEGQRSSKPWTEMSLGVRVPPESLDIRTSFHLTWPGFVT